MGAAGTEKELVTNTTLRGISEVGEAIGKTLINREGDPGSRLRDDSAM